MFLKSCWGLCSYQSSTPAELCVWGVRKVLVILSLPQSFATDTMSSGSAKIGQPAPDFTATAVVDGQFKDIKLSDYKGNGVISHRLCTPLGVEVLAVTTSVSDPQSSFVLTVCWPTLFESNQLLLGAYLMWFASFPSICALQGSMWCSSSTPWTSHLCVPLRSWLSATGQRSSAVLAARLSAAP